MNDEDLVAGERPVRCGDGDRSAGRSFRNHGPDVGGINPFDLHRCAVEQNLTRFGESLTQDLNHGSDLTVNWEIRHERRQAGVEAVERTHCRGPPNRSSSIQNAVRVLQQRVLRARSGAPIKSAELRACRTRIHQ